MAVLYFAVFPSATTPTWARANIATNAGFSGSPAMYGTQDPAAAAPQTNYEPTISWTGSLSAGTAYKIWAIWDDGTNTSNSGSPFGSAAFTTLDPQTVSVPAGTLTLTGYAPGVAATDHQTIAVPSGSLTLAGYAPSVVAPQAVSVPAGALTLTGYAPTVVAISGQVVGVPAGALTLTGYAPTVLAPVSVAVPAGVLTLTGYAPTVEAPRTIGVPAGALTLTGYAPTVETTSNQSVDVPAGSLTLTGYAPTVLGTLVTPDTPTKRGGGISRFVEARKRLPMPFLVDWLTNAEPTEATKRVIREVKAGRPIPHDVKPPKGPENISPARLAREILPERAYAFDTWLSDLVITSRAVEKAVQMARERDDEDILLLL